MDFSTKTSPLSDIRTDCLVIPLGKEKLSAQAKSVDKRCQGLISAVLDAGDFSGKLAQTLLLPKPAGLEAQRLLLVGTGKEESLDIAQAAELTQALAKALNATPAKHAVIACGELRVAEQTEAWLGQHLAQQLSAEQYRFARCKSDKQQTPTLKKVILHDDTPQRAKLLKQGAQQGKAIAAGMNVARELGNLPGNICTPAYLAKEARALGRKEKKISVKVLEEKDMKALGMGALLSVSAGSDEPAKLIVMEYKGGKKGDKPTVLVGKGITFDSGGISLKPGAAMDEMKYDMCGAASVFGAITALVGLDAAINVTAIVAASENMPSGRATKPGDIVTAMNGKTIEILNTDAEGRLILCDALSYAEQFKPKAVIDIATLTGACVIALGAHATGLYANHQPLADALLAAGSSSHDRAWQLPLWDDYSKQLKSNFADLANIGGREAGSVTAACFLSEFTKTYHWAHLDIAGTAWLSGANKGATGRPVPLLVNYLLANG